MILVVEDDVPTLESYVVIIERVLEDLGLEQTESIETALTFEEADDKISHLAEDEMSLILVDMVLPRGGWDDILAGYRLIKNYKERLPNARWVAMTSRLDMRGTTLETGMSVFEELYRLGLFGIWKKDEPQKLESYVRRFFAPRAKVQEPFFRGDLSPARAFVTQDHELASEIINVGSLDEGVLLFGERGTGKRIIAELLHKFSSRSEYRFATVDGQIEDVERLVLGEPSNLPFWKRQDSIFSDLSGGTLYIRHLDEAPPELQDKLWTYLASIERVDCRLIGGIERNRNEFRDDGSVNRDFLDGFYAFDVPPLRKRLGDVPVLIQLFVEQFNNETGHEKELTDFDAICDLLRGVDFPNNIAGLRRTVYEVLLKSSASVVTVEDFRHYLTARGLSEASSVPAESGEKSVIDVEGDEAVPTISVTDDDVNRLKRKWRD